MKPTSTLTHEFVELLPDTLEEGTIYISITYAIASHRCCCGCGNEVVTPLSPTDWKLIFDGHTVSFDPSIGNWSFPCQSHYWIKKGNVKWDYQWSNVRIEAGRANDLAAKQDYFDGGNRESELPPEFPAQSGANFEKRMTFLDIFRKLRWWK